MAVMYGAQQYTKAFGLAYCGLSEMQAASMTTMYQVGSIVAVAFWAVMMSKLKWHPLKVLIVDAVITAGSLLAVLLVHQVAIVYIAILILGFGCAGGALQTGLSVLQEFVPGPKGRNTGIYYTFMGAASYLMPVIVAKLTVISGESKAVYTLMTLMFILAVVQVVATLYLILRYKKVFGTTPLAKAE
jgi:MFS family permease